ncbi:MAG TPA: wax ester/triacylglycerol synthase family O-acyltransferase [Steroidobacteraceae bacterium]|nr:wax ester/triacylglycerol synthase family O-acyltransferase [Steroidobacteraceae bacterium]
MANETIAPRTPAVAQALSGADRAWLLMDRPTNPMVIVGLLVLATPLRLRALRALIVERFLPCERFRCVPVPGAAAAHWERSAGFDVDDHVLRAALPEPQGRDELEALAGELASTPLKEGIPLWTFHLVERYESGSAIIVRIHHCYADGIALVRVLLGMADASAALASRATPREEGAAPWPAGASGLLAESLPGILQQGASLLERGVHYALHPLEASAAARQALGLGAALTRLAMLPAEPASRLKQPLSGIRRVAWAEPLSLMEVATVGHVLGCTVNDVLVATLAGALGSYLRAQGDATDGLMLRAAVPVNLRTDAAPTLGNRFGLVFVELPVGIGHPLERLYAVRGAMQALKHSPQAAVVLGLLSVVGSLPAEAESPLVELFTSKASLVASSLPGPAEPLYFAGARISEILFWVPQAGSIGLGVSMFSYTGQIQYGVIADRQLLPDPSQLVERVQTEFERLVYLVLLGGGSLGS